MIVREESREFFTFLISEWMNGVIYSVLIDDYLGIMSTVSQLYVFDSIGVGNYSMSTFCETSASRPVFGTSSALLKMKDSLPCWLSAYLDLCQKSM